MKDFCINKSCTIKALRITSRKVNLNNVLQEFYLDRPSTTKSLGKNSIGGDSIYSVPALKLSTSCEQQESLEISEMTKDFSVCANTFGHSMKTESIPGLVCGQSTMLPEIYGEDEAAKDCLWCFSFSWFLWRYITKRDPKWCDDKIFL